MLRIVNHVIASVVLTISASACLDGFKGSNIQLELPAATPVQAQIGATTLGPRELPANGHFTLYAAQGGATTALTDFEIHRVVDVTSPCYIDVGLHVPHPGLHVTHFAERIAEDTGIADVAHPPASATEAQKIEAATADQREHNVEELGAVTGPHAVVSASSAVYPSVAADCTGSAGQIPPAMCIDDASNLRRLQLCQAAWAADRSMFEGSDRVITAPLNGVTYGMADGLNPVNEGPIGGAAFYLQNPLVDATALTYTIYFQIDGTDPPGTMVFQSVLVNGPTRGVTHVVFLGPGTPPIRAFMAVFADLGNDHVHF